MNRHIRKQHPEHSSEHVRNKTPSRGGDSTPFAFGMSPNHLLLSSPKEMRPGPSNSLPKDFICPHPECDKGFAHRKNLGRHIKEVRTQRDFSHFP